MKKIIMVTLLLIGISTMQGQVAGTPYLPIPTSVAVTPYIHIVDVYSYNGKSVLGTRGGGAMGSLSPFDYNSSALQQIADSQQQGVGIQGMGYNGEAIDPNATITIDVEANGPGLTTLLQNLTLSQSYNLVLAEHFQELQG